SPPFPADYSTVILDEQGEILRVFLNRREQWHLPPRGDLPLPEKLKVAVLTYEDRYFFYHPGINPAAVARALWQNLTSGKVISGASTITMQVARLMRPKPRTLPNKLLEMLQALKLEVRYSKEEILRLYLDHAPYGGNVVGYQAASLRYFGKLPEALTWGEAATLAVLPNAPGLISPDANPDLLKAKRDRLLRTLQQRGYIDEATRQLAEQEPLPAGSTPFPLLAPHLAQHLHHRFGAAGGVITTTLRKAYQQDIEALVREHAAYLKLQGIRNAAVLVAETGSGKVRAYVGSPDFFDAEASGQVDGVRAPRSSGSLLKPFLYALCMDEGILLPQTLVKDVPTFYGAFSPHNATETYDGLVTAREALVRSLNVPATRLLFTYGLHPFYLFLKSAGVSTLFRSPDDYGLPLILGGAEVTLWDMATLFRGLGNYGRFAPLQVLSKGNSLSPTPPPRLISPMACYLTLNMLRELKRPGAEYYWELYENQWPIAWKTGTSYGHRDAWAVGVSPQWTIAVWVGNFDGQGTPDLIGSRCAGPLLFDVFNYLPKDSRQAWFTPPPEAEQQPLMICRETGFLAGENCPHPVITEAPRGMKPLRLCPFHKRLYVTTDEQYQVCSLCWTPGRYKGVQRLVYPPDVAQHLRRRGVPVDAAPPHRPDCPAQTEPAALQILYPPENARLWVPRDFGGRRQRVAFRVAHRQRERTVYWYLDHHYLGATRDIHEKAVELTRGWHTLEVVDEIGYRDRRRFVVERR
ncbi:MAG: penicillin-binding protein 1C, partial [Calditrichaeota bacterium]